MAVWLEDTKTLPGGATQASWGMDELADIPKLPKMGDKCAPGSDAFAALEKRLVILNSKGEWV